MGCATNLFRIASIGAWCGRTDRRQVHGSRPPTTFANLENVRRKSCSGHRSVRFLYRADGYVSRALRFHRAPTRPAAGRSL